VPERIDEGYYSCSRGMRSNHHRMIYWQFYSLRYNLLYMPRGDRERPASLPEQEDKLQVALVQRHIGFLLTFRSITAACSRFAFRK